MVEAALVASLAVAGGLALALWRQWGQRRRAERASAEAALNRQRLENILWGTGVGTWEWNVQTGETRFNNRWAEIIGYRLEEVSPTTIETWMSFAHPEDLRDSEKRLEQHFSGARDHYECEARMRHKDGHWVWILDRGKVVSWTEDGKPEWMAGTHADISARKAAELELKETEAQFRQFAEGVDLVFWVRTETEMLYINPAYETIWGRSVESLYANPFSFVESIHPEDRERVLHALTVEFRRFGKFNEEYRILRPDGAVRCVRATSWPVVDEQGAFIRSVGTAVDITEALEAETALRELLDRMQKLAHHLPGMIYQYRQWPDGRTAFPHASDGIEAIYGVTAAEVQAEAAPVFEVIHPDDLVRVADGITHSAQTLEVWRDQYRVNHPTRGLLWLEGHATPERLEDGSILWHGYISDISARKQIELLLDQERQALERSNAELEQFAYIASHDLRQPLRMINSYTQLLDRSLKDSLGETEREFMGYIRDGAQRMDQMLVSLLEYSRVGRQGEPMECLNSRALAEEALAFLKPLIEESAGQVRLHGDWPTVTASRNEGVRLFQNLIGNALKYRAPDRAPEIDITVQAKGPFWEFSITDNGIGIDPSQTDRLFKVFQRLHTRGKYEGTGVGLAVCRKIVERHGGTIGVASDGEGQGSTFTFTLPRAAPQQERRHAPPS